MKKLCENAVLFLDPYVVEKDRGTPWLDCRDNYEWYYTYGKIYNPRSILEIGVRYGYSAFSLCYGSNCVEKLVLIDNEIDEVGSLEYSKNYIKNVFSNINITIFKENTSNFNNKFLNGEKFDMIHIDADHRPQSVINDLFNFWPFLNNGGIMILDDMRSLNGERSSPLIFHILPFILDQHDISYWTFINNYNCQMIMEKK